MIGRLLYTSRPIARRRPQAGRRPTRRPANRLTMAIPDRSCHLLTRVARGYIAGSRDRPEGATDAPSSLGPRSAALFCSRARANGTPRKATVKPLATPVGIWLECRARESCRARHSSQIPTGVARGLTVALRGVPFARARLQKRAAERGPRLEGASVAPSGRSREPAM